MFLKKGPKTAIFIEAKSGQFFYFYDQIQVTRTVHLAYYNMCEFCNFTTYCPIYYKNSKFEVGLQDFLEGTVQ
jgi:hypothetical protein